jgi:hypothetical protein
MSQPTLTYIPNEEFVASIRELADQLAVDSWQPGFIIGVGRGGLVPSTFLSHAINRPTLSVDYSAQVPGFSDEPLDRLAHMAAAGERLLFVDDINDTGRTIRHLRELLGAVPAGLENIRFAVLIDNIRSVETVNYRARTIDRAETKDWFVFPWEAIASQTAILTDAAAVPERTA